MYVDLIEKNASKLRLHVVSSLFLINYLGKNISMVLKVYMKKLPLPICFQWYNQILDLSQFNKHTDYHTGGSKNDFFKGLKTWREKHFLYPAQFSKAFSVKVIK